MRPDSEHYEALMPPISDENIRKIEDLNEGFNKGTVSSNIYRQSVELISKDHPEILWKLNADFIKNHTNDYIRWMARSFPTFKKLEYAKEKNPLNFASEIIYSCILEEIVAHKPIEAEASFEKVPQRLYVHLRNIAFWSSYLFRKILKRQIEGLASPSEISEQQIKDYESQIFTLDIHAYGELSQKKSYEDLKTQIESYDNSLGILLNKGKELKKKGYIKTETEIQEIFHQLNQHQQNFQDRKISLLDYIQRSAQTLETGRTKLGHHQGMEALFKGLLNFFIFLFTLTLSYWISGKYEIVSQETDLNEPLRTVENCWEKMRFTLFEKPCSKGLSKVSPSNSPLT